MPTFAGADAAWVRNPVDAFVLAKLTEKGLAPSPEADRRTLIRRLYFDLIGLPPTPEEVDGSSPIRTRRRTRSSSTGCSPRPRYGERWARHWLDVVHYGDTHGYDKDKVRPNAWPYRDYVIRAFNEDKPYDRFVKEQLAGDGFYPGTADGVAALGFLAAGPWDFVGQVEVREGTLEKARVRNIDRDDMVSVDDEHVRQPDRAVRPLPRPQVRPDQPGGLLQPAGGVRRGRPRRPAVRRGPGRRAAAPRDRAARASN